MDSEAHQPSTLSLAAERRKNVAPVARPGFARLHKFASSPGGATEASIPEPSSSAAPRLKTNSGSSSTPASRPGLHSFAAPRLTSQVSCSRARRLSDVFGSTDDPFDLALRHVAHRQECLCHTDRSGLCYIDRECLCYITRWRAAYPESLSRSGIVPRHPSRKSSRSRP